MHWYLIVGVIVLLLGGAFFFTSAGQLVKTLILIARVSPYEQPGGGAGSILVIGDSTGYGTGASKSSDSVVGRLGNLYTWYHIENDSKNGRTVAGAQAVATDVKKSYNLIILQIGANDLIQERAVGDVVADMDTLVQTLRPHTEHIVILTSGNIGAVPRYTGAKAKEYANVSRTYTEAMIQFANKYQDVSFVPLFDEPQDDVFVADPKRYIAFDGLHPSSEGYRIWFEKALPYFTAVMEEK